MCVVVICRYQTGWLALGRLLDVHFVVGAKPRRNKIFIVHQELCVYWLAILACGAFTCSYSIRSNGQMAKQLDSIWGNLIRLHTKNKSPLILNNCLILSVNICWRLKKCTMLFQKLKKNNHTRAQTRFRVSWVFIWLAEELPCLNILMNAHVCVCVCAK